jgi:hypothetical protein
MFFVRLLSPSYNLLTYQATAVAVEFELIARAAAARYSSVSRVYAVVITSAVVE